MKKFNVKNKFSATRNLQRHLRTVHKNKQFNTEAANVSVSLNIAHLNIESVAISDLLIMPVDPLTHDILPLHLANDSLPIDLMSNYLDKAFLIPSEA